MIRYAVFIALTLGMLIENAAANPIFHNERFGDIQVLRTTRDSDRSIILFSDIDGYEGRSQRIAQQLSSSGMVIAVDTTRYRSGLEENGDSAACLYLAGEVERLGQTIENEIGDSEYTKPVIVGVGRGSTLAYVAYMQHPESFAGLVTEPLCELIAMRPLPCAEGKLSLKIEHERAHLIAGADQTAAIWANINGSDAHGCYAGDDLRAQADEDLLPKPSNPNQSDRTVLQRTVQKVIDLADEREKNQGHVVEVESHGNPGAPILIFLSGDGGWATIDKQLGEYLGAHGFPMVGFDALRFFWKPKQPKDVAREIEQIFNDYSVLWNRDRLVLLGFSLGADALAVALPNLSPEIRRKLDAVILLSPGLQTDLEIHIGDWLGISADDAAYKIQPAVSAFPDTPLLCLNGSEEHEESLCPVLQRAHTETKELEGSHHFDGAYEKVAGMISAFISGARSELPTPIPAQQRREEAQNSAH